MNSNHFADKDNLSILAAVCGLSAAQAITSKYPTLTDISRATHEELCQLEGVGEHRALQAKAALELAGRLSREILGESPLVDTPERVADLLRDEIRPYTIETFKIILLNTRRRLIKIHTAATGTLDTLLVHAREVFRPAIAANAASIVLTHNHPSGDPTPSEADLRWTRDLIRAGQLLKIEVVDHIIMGTRTGDHRTVRAQRRAVRPAGGHGNHVGCRGWNRGLTIPIHSPCDYRTVASYSQAVQAAGGDANDVGRSRGHIGHAKPIPARRDHRPVSAQGFRQKAAEFPCPR
jgi:DNA repair protein RadC